MKIMNSLPFAQGVNPVYWEKDKMGLKFNIIRLNIGEQYISVKNIKRFYILLSGKVSVQYTENKELYDMGSGMDGCFRKRKLCQWKLQAGSSAVISAASEHVYMAEIYFENANGVYTEEEPYISVLTTGQGSWDSFLKQREENRSLGFFGFYPDNGFGLLHIGNYAHLIENYTCVVNDELEASYVCAPGYAGYSLWVEWEDKK